MTQTISAGYNHSLVIDPEGRVWAFGSNIESQLGVGDAEDRDVPTQINRFVGVDAPPEIVSVAVGSQHSLFLDRQGQVWISGLNTHEFIPIKIESFEGVDPAPLIIAISAGKDHYLLLDNQGHVWAFGKNRTGQLGIPIDEFEEEEYPPKMISTFYGPDGQGFYEPQPIPFMVKVSAGESHSLLLDRDGQVWSFGANYDGQLGTDRDFREPPVRIHQFEGGESTPVIIDISAGERHSLFLDQSGHVWATGSTGNYQLGIGGGDLPRAIFTPVRIDYSDDNPLIVSVKAGSEHSLILDQTGGVWSFGFGDRGQLGLGEEQVEESPRLIPNLPPMMAISAGRDHSLIMDEQGQVWGFGKGDEGQLGLGLVLDHISVPTKIEGLMAKLSETTTTDEHKPIFTVYPIIEQLFQRGVITDYRFRTDLMDLEHPENIMTEFEDNQGQVYLSRIQYDSDKDQVYPPSLAESYFDRLQQNISRLTEYQFRPEFDQGLNKGFEFIDRTGQRYLMLVQVDSSGQIYPPQ